MINQPQTGEPGGDPDSMNWLTRPCPHIYGVCPNCHAPIIEEDANFCYRCGQKLPQADNHRIVWTFVKPVFSPAGHVPSLEDTFSVEYPGADSLEGISAMLDAGRDDKPGLIISYHADEIDDERVHALEIYQWAPHLLDHRDLGPCTLKITNLENEGHLIE